MQEKKPDKTITNILADNYATHLMQTNLLEPQEVNVLHLFHLQKRVVFIANYQLEDSKHTKNNNPLHAYCK